MLLDLEGRFGVRSANSVAREEKEAPSSAMRSEEQPLGRQVDGLMVHGSEFTVQSYRTALY